MIDGTVEGGYTDEVLALATEAIREGEYALKAEWGAALITSKAWKKYDMDNAIRGKFSEDEDTKEKQQDYLADVNEEYTAKWAEYQLDDVKVGIFHNTDNRTGRDKQAEKCLEIYKTEGKEALKKYWDSEFKSIVPSEDDKVSDVSEWRFNYFWDYYQMDDVMEGKYHGKLVNYTPTMLEYIAKMDNVATNPERQGCVAVTRELAEILDTLVSREVFENVQGGWLKFCYYYDILGADAE